MRCCGMDCKSKEAILVDGRSAKNLRLCIDCAPKYVPLEELKKFKRGKDA